MPELLKSYEGLILLMAVPGLDCLLVLFGRKLKRRHQVSLGWLYHLFAISLAVYLQAVMLRLPWAFLHHLGDAVIILSATVLFAVVDRYGWGLYFQVRHGVAVPKFLSDLARLGILAVAIFLVLEFG